MAAGSDTAALVVALSAQVSKFEKDMQSAVKIADTNTKSIEDRFAKMNQEINNQLSGLTNNLSGQLGGLGRVLTAIGPVGATLAIGIGAAALAFKSISESAEKFIEKQKNLKEAAETSGLTLNEFKALGVAGKAVGVEFEQTEKFVDKLTTSIADLRTNGTGPLRDQLERIQPGLAKQVALSNSTAQAVDLVTAAFDKLDNQFQKNEFIKSISGGRNLAGGRILDFLGGQGGLSGFTQTIVDAGKGVDEQLNTRLAQTKIKLDQIRATTDNIWGQLFSETILGLQIKEAEQWQKIAEAAKSSAEWIKDYLSSRKELTTAPPLPEPEPGQGPMMGDIGFLPRQRGIDPATGRPRSGQSGAPSFDETGMLPGAPLPLPRPQILQQNDELEKQRIALTQDIAKLEEWIAAMKGSADQTDVLFLEELKLRKAVIDRKLSQEEANLVLDDATIALRIQNTAVREKLGIATEQQIVEQKLLEVEQQRRKGLIDSTELEKANTKARLDAKKAIEAMNVAASQTPQLTKFALDAKDGFKQFDTFMTTAFSGFENAMASVANGTTKLSDAFKNMANSIIADLVRIALRMSITGPIASALSGLFSGGATPFNAFFGGGSPSGYGVSGKQSGGPVTGGRPYVVGEHGPELFVPGQSGTIVPNVSKGSSGGGTTVEVNNYVAADTETKQTTQQGPNADRVIIDIVKKAQARGELDDTNRGRFGLRPNKVR